jgi:hypothetical protein
VPKPHQLNRAQKYGLCMECTHLPVVEGRSYCARCIETRRLRRIRYRQKDALRNRVKRTNAKLLANYGREVAFALEYGHPAPPPPILVTFVPQKWRWYRRLRNWTRRKPKKRYKYTPRALPSAEEK